MGCFHWILFLYILEPVLASMRIDLKNTNLTCPYPDGSPIFLTDGTITIQRALHGNLCTLSAASLNNNSVVTSLIPLARSYDGFDWERAAGEFATAFYRNQSWTCDYNSSSCQITLPLLQNGMLYRIASYNRTLPQRDEIARFLETTTFGITQVELAQFYNITDNGNSTGNLETRMAQWVWKQMNASLVGITSHREYWRQRANMRANGAFRVGIPHHPCKALSRWRTFAFSKLDTVDQKRALLLGYKLNNKWVLTVDGQPRTVVSSFNLQANTNYTFCSTPPTPNNQSLNGNMYVRLNSTVFENCVAIPNSLVDMTQYDTLLGVLVLTLPSRSSGFIAVDQGNVIGDEFLLQQNLSDAKCDSIPEVIDFTTPPIFGRHPNGEWLLFDPHLALDTNTPMQPMSDGGRANLLDSYEQTICSNVRRSFLNENQCIVPTNVSVCRPLYPQEVALTLSDFNIRQLYNLTGRYVYAIKGLPVVDQYGNKLLHPCTPNLRSRWLLSDESNCTTISIQPQTFDTLSWLFKTSFDRNSYLRDITFPTTGLSCDKNDTNPSVVLNINGTCYTRVHPDYLSVFDMTYWTYNNTHPGNAIAQKVGHRNPIKKWAEDGSSYLVFPAIHPLDPSLNHDLSRWNIYFNNFTYLGRFEDSILIDSLSSGLQVNSVLRFFGAASVDMANTTKAVLCGSPGEVSNIETYGNVFDVFSAGRTVNADTILEYNAEVVWTMAALQATDQLRQRVSWALAQLLVVVREAIQNDNLKTEWYINYYDIIVRNAFANYRDVLKHISFSPLMAESLTYLNSKSSAFMLENYQLVTAADENFAREVMQLFTIGVNRLNIDGTPVVDSNGDEVLNYNNDDITSFARVWTGFTAQTSRSNFEDNGGNKIDPMRINPTWRDRFVKTNLQNGFIGDGYPLCEDFPKMMFLRQGAKYNYLGDSNIPELLSDPLQFQIDPSTSKLVLPDNSDLRLALCNPDKGGICQYSSTVVLASDLTCFGIECNIESIRVVQVGNVFYEYVHQPCIRHAFFNSAIKLIRSVNTEPITCANPSLLDASIACCDMGSTVAKRNVFYDGERSSFEAALRRCLDLNQTLCNMRYIDTPTAFKLSSYHWTSESCKVTVKVNPSGRVAIVYEPTSYTVVDAPVNIASENWFTVYWSDGSYPQAANNGSTYCKNYLDNCVCDMIVEISQVYTSMPSSKEEVLAKLHIGALHPDIYYKGQFTPVSNLSTGITAYLNGTGQIDSTTIFTFVDSKQRRYMFKNIVSIVRLIDFNGSSTTFSFRNPPHFISLVPTEASIGDCLYETEAALDEYFYHDSTAPFIASRLIQRLVSSNPTPRFVAAAAQAFRSGLYSSSGIIYGYGKYGDLAATVACIILDREARNIQLDNDPSNGMLREPLLKVMALMRSGSFVPLSSTPLPSNSRIGDAFLVSPESVVLSIPKIIGMLNGMISLISSGLSSSNGGFGWTGETVTPTGYLSLNSSLSTFRNISSIVDELATLWTAGRLSPSTRKNITATVNSYSASSTLKTQLAQILVASSAEFHATSLVRSTGSSRSSFSFPSSTKTSYKAVIYVMFTGGCDSFNLLAPYSCSKGTDLYAQYVSLRQQVALPKSRLLPVSTQKQVCETFGIHESLPTVYNLYTQGDLAFLANVGVMDTNLNKTNYQTLSTTQLYSHSAMQYAVQRIDPTGKRSKTGVIGRMSEMIRKYGLNTGSFYIDDYSVALAGEKVDPLGVSQNGFVNLATTNNTKNAVLGINPYTSADSGFFADIWSDSISQSIRMSDVLSTLMNNVSLKNSFPTSDIGSRFATVAKLINTKSNRGSNFDSFFIDFGSFDTHSNLDSVSTGLFNRFDAALSSFVAEIKTMGLWNQVLTVQVSDFGRTLNPNGNDGTDHGWGGNYLILGGSVKGGQILGSYPNDLSEEGSLNLGRGRIIPTTSWDSVFSAVAKWVGVQDVDLINVCPNMNSFPLSKQIKVNDLFDGYSPTNQPSTRPSRKPVRPTSRPTPRKPSTRPSRKPVRPTSRPTPRKPTSRPTPRKPTSRPSPRNKPTRKPSGRPNQKPTSKPKPAKPYPTVPIRKPTTKPTIKLTKRPSFRPTKMPSTTKPSARPSNKPSTNRTARPSYEPSTAPSVRPTAQPTRNPSARPSAYPTTRPRTSRPTRKPSTRPSAYPTTRPRTSIPTREPSPRPLTSPTVQPTGKTTSATPSTHPTAWPSMKPTSASPSFRTPTNTPTGQPTTIPTTQS